MPLLVDAQPIGVKLHRLVIYHDGQRIGEYERSQAGDIDRKTREVQKALPELLEIFRTRGEFRVRWNGRNNAKSVRVNGVEVWQIPRDPGKRRRGRRTMLSNWSFDTDAQGRPRLRRSCSLVSGQLRR